MKTVVGFLSRPHGYNVLTALTQSDEYELKTVYTHALNPQSQDPTRSQRYDYSLFVEICARNNIPLFAIDSNKEKITNFPSCDFIIEVSWKYLIPTDITKQAKIAAFGIHRGKLPDYAGLEPIKQSLLKREKEIIISAHYLDNIIDKGKTIATISHPINYDQTKTFEENIQILRDEITPLFSKLAFKTLNLLNKQSVNYS